MGLGSRKADFVDSVDSINPAGGGFRLLHSPTPSKSIALAMPIASASFGSLSRATDPEAVATTLKLKHGDRLLWEMKVVDGQLTVVVKKAEN